MPFTTDYIIKCKDVGILLMVLFYCGFFFHVSSVKSGIRSVMI